MLQRLRCGSCDGMRKGELCYGAVFGNGDSNGCGVSGHGEGMGRYRTACGGYEVSHGRYRDRVHDRRAVCGCRGGCYGLPSERHRCRRGGWGRDDFSAGRPVSARGPSAVAERRYLARGVAVSGGRNAVSRAPCDPSSTRNAEGESAVIMQWARGCASCRSGTGRTRKTIVRIPWTVETTPEVARTFTRQRDAGEFVPGIQDGARGQ